MRLSLAANLSLMYAHLPWGERAKAAADDGFRHVEMQFPYENSAAQWRQWLDESETQLVLINAPPGEWVKGDRGLAAIPGREAEFEASIELALAYCGATRCSKLHVMSGTADLEDAASRNTWIRNFQVACAAARSAGVMLLVEPLNTKDFPGYFISRQTDALALIDAVGVDNLRLQFDFYHLQIMEGDVLEHWARHRGQTGHVQIAGVPGRHEPDTGDLAYQKVFGALSDSGWVEPVGCEYKPRIPTREGVRAGLQWRSRFGLA